MSITLPRRPDDGHKGTFGTVLVVGGCDDVDSMMLGGPAFSALGALRSGSGRCVLATPKQVLAEALGAAPSATGLPLAEDESAIDRIRVAAREVQAEVVGPGFGRSGWAVAIVRDRLASTGPPLVLDADGLNALARCPEMVPGERALVLTPHPGEYQRMAMAFELSPSVAGKTDDERTTAASTLAGHTGGTVVLKGDRTVVSDGLRSWVCEVGSVSLATAGTGDVLSGVLGGLLAQPSENDVFENAVLGVWLHAMAGDLWSSRHGDRGLLAADLAAAIPDVLQECVSGRRALPAVQS